MMVSARPGIQKKMGEFVAERLSASKLFEVTELRENYLTAMESPVWTERPRKAFIFLHTGGITLDEVSAVWREKRDHEQMHIGHIFLKDAGLYFVGLSKQTARIASKRSLKKYHHDTINEMVHLRGLEKMVLNSGHGMLTYFSSGHRCGLQLSTYSMQNVHLDYSHLPSKDILSDDPETRRKEELKLEHAKPHISSNYKIPAHEISCDEKKFAMLHFDRAPYFRRRALVTRASFDPMSIKIFP